MPLAGGLAWAEAMPLRVLLAGTSTRAAADSAARAQFEVTAIKGHGVEECAVTLSA